MSSPPIAPATAGTSTRPYLIRALHDWCTDIGFTPYLAVHVDRSVQVPMEYVKNNEIVLNVGFEATSSLKLGNDFIEFHKVAILLQPGGDGYFGDGFAHGGHFHFLNGSVGLHRFGRWCWG